MICYVIKLADPNIRIKTYWSILKSFSTGKKVPCIPLMFHQDSFITDFKQKAELFNSFFANQCSLINDSNIPTDSHLLTDKCLSNVTFTDDDDTVKVVIGLNPNRALERDMISICIKKLCENSIFRLSEFIF